MFILVGSRASYRSLPPFDRRRSALRLSILSQWDAIPDHLNGLNKTLKASLKRLNVIFNQPTNIRKGSTPGKYCGAIPFNIHTPRWKRFSEGVLERHFWGAHCISAFDLLNISEGFGKKIAFFSEGKRKFRQFLMGRGGGHVSALLIFDS